MNLYGSRYRKGCCNMQRCNDITTHKSSTRAIPLSIRPKKTCSYSEVLPACYRPRWSATCNSPTNNACHRWGSIFAIFEHSDWTRYAPACFSMLASLQLNSLHRNWNHHFGTHVCCSRRPSPAGVAVIKIRGKASPPRPK